MRINGKSPRQIMQISSLREFWEWIPLSFVQVLVLSAFALTALAPLLISLKAVSYVKPEFYLGNEIDKYYIYEFQKDDFDVFMHTKVFPYVFFITLLAVIILFFKRRVDRNAKLLDLRQQTPLALFALFSIWLGINVFLVNGPTFYAIHGKRPNHENIYIYLEYFFCFLGAGLLLTKKQKRWFHYFLTIVSLVLVPFAIYLHQKTYTKDVIVSVFANSNYYGNYLNVVISLCVCILAGMTNKKHTTFLIAAIIINTVVFYFNNTFGAWVGAFFACLFSILAFRIRDGKWNRRAILALVLFLACLIVCGFIDSAFIHKGNNNFTQNIMSLLRDIFNIKADPNSSTAAHAGSGRWKIWKYYLGLVKEHPLFGIGLDGVRALDIGQEINQKRCHNEYLNYAAFVGIPGLLLYFSACLSVYIRALKFRKFLDNVTLAALTAAFGYLVGAFFSNTMYNVTPYLYIMLGLGYVQFNGANDK